MSIITIEKLCHSYGGSLVLDQLDMKASAGKLQAVIGPNGCGKTTLIKIILGLIRPVSGKILLSDKAVSGWKSSERGKMIAYMGQNTTIWMPYSVREIILMGAYPHLGMTGRCGNRYDEDVESLLSEVGLGGLGDREYSRLSGGQQQLVQLCRVFMQKAPVILLDEPVSNLDLKFQHKVMSLLKTRAEEGSCILMSLHSLSLAHDYCDILYVLNQGRIVAEGSAASVLTKERIEEIYQVDSKIAEKVKSRF